MSGIGRDVRANIATIQAAGSLGDGFAGTWLSSHCLAVCTKTPVLLPTRKLRLHCGDFVQEKLTWRTKQLVNSRRRYVSTKPVRRFLSQELVVITIF